MEKDRKITADDLNSAVRGLGMWRQPNSYLENLIQIHGKPDALFASRVICEAAKQVIAARKAMGVEK